VPRGLTRKIDRKIPIVVLGSGVASSHTLLVHRVHMRKKSMCVRAGVSHIVVVSATNPIRKIYVARSVKSKGQEARGLSIPGLSNSFFMSGVKCP
jgi:hypothetical protein